MFSLSDALKRQHVCKEQLDESEQITFAIEGFLR
jgi:hypothetical protein